MYRFLTVVLCSLLAVGALRVDDWDVTVRFRDETCSLVFNESFRVQPDTSIIRFTRVLLTPHDDHERAILHDIGASVDILDADYTVNIVPTEGPRVLVHVRFATHNSQPFTVNIFYAAVNGMRTDSYYNTMDWPVYKADSFQYAANKTAPSYPAASVNLVAFHGLFPRPDSTSDGHRIFNSGECATMIDSESAEEQLVCPARQMTPTQVFRLQLVYLPTRIDSCPFDAEAHAFRSMTMILATILLFFMCVCCIWCIWCRHKPLIRMWWNSEWRELDDDDDHQERQRVATTGFVNSSRASNVARYGSLQ